MLCALIVALQSPEDMLCCAVRCAVQVMVTKEVAEEIGGLKQLTATSTCVLIEGVLAETPAGTKQKVRECCHAVLAAACIRCSASAITSFPLLLCYQRRGLPGSLLASSAACSLLHQAEGREWRISRFCRP
jgi:hypothetical protein